MGVRLEVMMVVMMLHQTWLCYPNRSLAGRLAGHLVGHLVGRLVGRLVGWRGVRLVVIQVSLLSPFPTSLGIRRLYQLPLLSCPHPNRGTRAD